MANAAKIGAYAMQKLKTLPGVKALRGLGLMIGIEFDFPVAALRKRLAFEQKIFVGSSSEANTVRLLPPLSISEKEVDFLVEKMKIEIEKEMQLA